MNVDTKADTIIADHLRTDSPAGSLSYTWIEACIRQQDLVDTTEHQAGHKPGTARPVGALRPQRGKRVEFSAADDMELWHWVHKYGPRSKGVLGGELYKQLEAKVCTTQYIKGIRLINAAERPTHVAVVAGPLEEIRVKTSPSRL